MTSAQDLINRIRHGDDSALEELYVSERTPFLMWAQKNFKCPEHDAKELYQIIVLIVYDNIVQDRLTEIHCALRSYLYAVAKNKWKEWIRARQKVRHTDVPYFADLLENEAPEKYSDEMVHTMYAALKRIGRPCQKLIESYYYQRKSMSEIALEMGYKNPETTKNLKYKCIQRLKKMVANRITRPLTHTNQSYS